MPKPFNPTGSHPYPAEAPRVIWVRGTEREIGRSHAAQLGESLKNGMAPFYYGFFRRLLSPQALPPFEKWSFRLLAQVVDGFLIKKLVAQIPEGFRQRIAGVSEVSGISEEAFLTALILPDLLPMLQAHWIRWKPGLAIPVEFPVKFGCSSFVAKSGRFLQGRNLDFPGVAYWDRYPVIQVTQPQQGFKYIGITSAGVPLAGISGVNEVGISVSLHQHYSVETYWSGQLPFVISEKILNEADSLESAREILENSKLASSWAFVVADGKTRDAFIYEATPYRSGVRRLAQENDLLVHTNYFQSKECRNKDYATTERMNWDNLWRKTTLEQNLRQQFESLTPETAAQALSSHWDGFWREEKIVNRTVSQVYNIQSYVLDLAEMKLFLAAGDSPIHLRGYQKIDLAQLFQGAPSQLESVLNAYQFKNEEIRKAKEQYIFSFVAAFNNDFELAWEQLQTSLEYCFTPEAAFVAALINLRLEGDLQVTFDWLSRGRSEIERKCQEKGLCLFPPEYFEILIYLARTYDLQGKRIEALKVYRQMVQESSLRDGNLKRIAEKAQSYQQKQIKRLVMPYSSYIPFE